MSEHVHLFSWWESPGGNFRQRGERKCQGVYAFLMGDRGEEVSGCVLLFP